MCMKKEYRRQQLNNRFRGYCKIPKVFFTNSSFGLTRAERTFYIFCFAVLADWDSKKSHARVFGSFDYTDEEISYLYGGCPSNVSKLKKSLLEKGFLYVRLDGLTTLKGFGSILKNPNIRDLEELEQLIQKSLSNDEEFMNYLEKSREIVNVEYLEYHGITANPKGSDYCKVLIDSFKCLSKDKSKEVDINIDEISKYLESEPLEGKGGDANI